MESLFTIVYGDPMYVIGLLFALAAAIAFLVFLRGFLAGLPHLFTISGNEEFLPDHRRRVVWGFFMLVALFVVWQIVRWIGGLFS